MLPHHSTPSILFYNLQLPPLTTGHFNLPRVYTYYQASLSPSNILIVWCCLVTEIGFTTTERMLTAVSAIGTIVSYCILLYRTVTVDGAAGRSSVLAGKPNLFDVMTVDISRQFSPFGGKRVCVAATNNDNAVEQ